ncbi:MAG: GNA1162 family protein, partial [Hydrogenophaga sp.]
GKAIASSAEQQQQAQGGLVGLLVTAVVQQIAGTATDAAFTYAGIANQRMLGAPRYNGILPGPRSPLRGQIPTDKLQ